MTLGEIIRKLRGLNNLSQESLGVKMGMTRTSAGPSIRKYEADIVAPKTELREKMITALNVDESALTSFDFSTPENIIHALFELENDNGLVLKRENGKTFFVVDESDPRFLQLATYVYRWQQIKSQRFLGKSNDEYLLWQSRFVTETEKEFSKRIIDVKELYEPEMAILAESFSPVNRTTDLTRLLRRMLDVGMSVMLLQGGERIGLSFDLQEVMQPSSAQAKELFAEFLLNIRFMKSLRKKMEELLSSDIVIIDNRMRIVFYIPNIPAFGPVVSSFGKILDFYRKPAEERTEQAAQFDKDLEDEMTSLWNDLKVEIEWYYPE